jgi:uncharacterized protein (TIGR02466 family)
MQLKEMSVFATYIYHKEIITDIDLEKIARDLESSNKSKPKASNSGGWQSEKQNFNSIEIMQPLLREIIESLNSIYENYGIPFAPSTLEYWFNINRKYNFNWMHNHPSFFFSAVYYVNEPKNSGNIIFERPDAANDWITPETYNIRNMPSLSVSPKANNLLVFPSYLKHRVEQNLSDEDRISIAFNIK